MRYDDPELHDRLAAEYVLGTLHGAARRRFERLMLSGTRLRATVYGWERRLGGWALRLPPETPSPRVWRAIQARIAPAPVTPRLPWRLRLGWPVAALATAAAVVLAVALVLTRPVTQQPDYLAVVSGEAGTTLWSITADIENEELLVRAVNPKPPPPGRDLELWLLPEGEQPISLGLLPRSGTAERRLPADELPPGEPAKLAVSVEPAGGSPTGLPTGSVIYQTPLLPL